LYALPLVLSRASSARACMRGEKFASKYPAFAVRHDEVRKSAVGFDRREGVFGFVGRNRRWE
jgi:hypothetical protein